MPLMNALFCDRKGSIRVRSFHSCLRRWVRGQKAGLRGKALPTSALEEIDGFMYSDGFLFVDGKCTASNAVLEKSRVKMIDVAVGKGGLTVLLSTHVVDVFCDRHLRCRSCPPCTTHDIDNFASSQRKIALT